jgi:hypothetical protein
VYRGAYEFAVPGAPQDYLMQTTPDAEQNVLHQVGGLGVTGNGHNGHNGHKH